MSANARSPEGFAVQIGCAIDETVERSAGRKALVDRKLRTVLEESGGWTRRGRSNIRQITEALARSAIHTDWSLDDPDLTLDSYVWFARHPIRRRELAPSPFSNEDELISFIASRYRALFRGVDELRDVRLVGTEVTYRRIAALNVADLEFEDPSGGRVVVEVELGDPQENSAFQVRKYMQTAGAALGVLISARPSNAELERAILEELEDMAPKLPTVWLTYELSMERLR